MKSILGFAMFWMGMGMLLMMFLPVCFGSVLFVGILLALGYYLFCK